MTTLKDAFMHKLTRRFNGEPHKWSREQLRRNLEWLLTENNPDTLEKTHLFLLGVHRQALAEDLLAYRLMLTEVMTEYSILLDQYEALLTEREDNTEGERKI